MVSDIVQIVFAGSTMVVTLDCLLMLMVYNVAKHRMENKIGGDE